MADALRDGASGFVAKLALFEELAPTIRTMPGGKAGFPSVFMARPQSGLTGHNVCTTPVMRSTLPAAYAERMDSRGHVLRRVLHDNGLSFVLIFAFVALWFAQAYSGWSTYNQDREDHGRSALTFGQYLGTGHFVEATAENWESEFLQMAAFVWLTVFLVQKGSPESRGVDGNEEQDREPNPAKPDAPWPVRKGGLALKLYSHSLTLAFLLLFVVAFALHAWGGARVYSEQQLEHGQPAVGVLQFMGTSDFWFESMQNWQSEFLAIAMMVILSVFLRQKGSPESKPVDAPHDASE